MPVKKEGPTPRTPHVKLAVITEQDAAGRSIIRYTGPGTVAMKGDATRLVMDCGSCGSPIIDGVALGQLVNLVFVCNRCGACNETLN